MRARMHLAAILTGEICFVCVCAGAALAAKQDDIWGMLKKDHDQVKKILKQLKNGEDGTQFNVLQQMLAVHMRFEEQYLYPTLKKNHAISSYGQTGDGEHGESAGR